MRASCGDALHQRPDAGAGRRSIQRHLRGTLQQGEHIADAGLPAPGFHRVAGAVAGGLLPGVLIDGVHIKIHRKRSVDTEAFYVALAVKEDKTREVLGIFNKLTESIIGWGQMLEDLHERGVGKIGLICADSLKGLEEVIGEVFPGAKLQRCTIHLRRNLLGDVRNGDKGDVADDLRQVVRTGDRNCTVEQAWEEWQRFCAKWGKYYRIFRKRGEDASCMAYFTYLNYDHRIHSIIYTTNLIERLQRDFRRVTRMHGAMPNEESVILLMGKAAMDKTSYRRQVSKIDLDKEMFPDE